MKSQPTNPAPHYSTHSDHQRTRLAQSTVATVDICDCGTIQLHLGSITLRLSRAGLAALATTLEDAANELNTRIMQEMHIQPLIAAKPGKA